MLVAPFPLALMILSLSNYATEVVATMTGFFGGAKNQRAGLTHMRRLTSQSKASLAN